MALLFSRNKLNVIQSNAPNSALCPISKAGYLAIIKIGWLEILGKHKCLSNISYVQIKISSVDDPLG